MFDIHEPPRPIKALVRELARELPKHHFDSGVGIRIRQRREELGLSQRDLKFWRCSAAYISRIEAGDRIPSFQVLMKLSILLATTPEWLAFGIGAKEAITPPALRPLCGQNDSLRQNLLALIAELRRSRSSRLDAAAA